MTKGNDKTQGSTFAAFNQLHLDEIGGRWTAEQQRIINGAKPIVDYPGKPDWAVQLPDEPPLGWSVEAQEPCGEPHEIQASLDQISCSSSVSSEEQTEPRSDSSPVSIVERGSPFRKRRI